MIALKFITHPLTLIISFITLLISGQHIGGFYIVYLILGLSHASIHSILGFTGIGLLLFGNIKSKHWDKHFVIIFVNLAGIIFMWTSLFLFFYNDHDNYNIATLYESVPLTLILIFFLISFSSFVCNVLLLIRHPREGLS